MDIQYGTGGEKNRNWTHCKQFHGSGPQKIVVGD